MYLDESGTDDLTHVNQEQHQFLGLTGVIIRLDHGRDFCVPDLARIKAEFFDHDPDHPPIFHREDILNKRREFAILRDEAIRARFDDAIIKHFDDATCTVITAVVDKRAMMAKANWDNKHPYHYLMEILVEKYVQFLERHDDIGDIMPEMRRGKKDKDLQDQYLRVWRFGTYFVPRQRIQARLPAKNLKFRDKPANIAGLQLCDLIAHPSLIHVRQWRGHNVTPGPFALRVIELLKQKKYDRNLWGKISGYGIKYFP